jgi:hypothetical protein
MAGPHPAVLISTTKEILCSYSDGKEILSFFETPRFITMLMRQIDALSSNRLQSDLKNGSND